jgi:hypothetical protein
MKKEEVIFQVQSSLGSLFTKDDVINCLNMVVEEPKVEETKNYAIDGDELIQRIKDGLTKVMDEIDFNDSDNFEITDCEFSINRGNEVELESFEVYGYQLKDLVRSEIQDFLSNLRDEIEQEREAKEEAVEEN